VQALKNNAANTDADIKKVCRHCGLEFPATIEYFHREKAGLHGVNSICIECKLSYQKNRRCNDEYRARERCRIKANDKLRLSRNVACSIRNSIFAGKNGRHWESLVDFTLSELMRHIEKRFSAGMTWQNYGQWHIDHKIPVSAFNFSTPEHIDFKRCWSLKNLQPMWAKENISKSDKLEKPFQPFLPLPIGGQ
jgi:hypothetical protein